LTQSQAQIWIGQQLAPAAPLYNTAFTFRIHGAIDEDRFERAFRQCVNDCDALRTVFAENRDGPCTVVRPDLVVPLERVDVSNSAHPAQDAARLVAERCRRPFQVGERLLDAILIKLSANDNLWFLNQHHLITDAWSTSLIYEYVEACYRSQTSDESIPPPPPFADFVAYERAQREVADNESVAHWQDKAVRAAKPGRLYGRDNPAQSSDSERRVLELGQPLTKRLYEVAEEPGVRSLTPDLSLFNIFATVVLALLHRATGEEALSLGTPAHNRTRPGFRETIGLFIELFPLQAKVSGDDTFADVLARVQKETNSFLRHAQPGSSAAAASRSFNVVLNYLNLSFPPFDGQPVDVAWLHPGHSDESHHLRVQVHDFHDRGSLSVLFDFNCDVFPEEQRTWAMHHFARLLDTFLEDRTRRVNEADIVHVDERQLLTTGFFSPALSLPESTVTEAIERIASRQPDAAAVSASDGSFSYGELNGRADALASRLLAAGVAPGDTVGLLADRHAVTLVGILGILKARAAYLPIAPDHPAARSSFMFDDAGVAILVAAKPVAGWEDGPRIDPSTPPDAPPPGHFAPAVPDDLAYVLYTSGSTGRPKGVLVEHRQILNLVAGLQERIYAAQPERQRVALVAPFVFDASVQQIFAALLLGHELVVVPEETRLDGAALLRFYHDRAIDISDGTPAHLALLARGTPGGPQSARVRHFIIGGEELRPSMLREFYDRFPDGDPVITNVYGPTECCVDSTSFAVTRESLLTLGDKVPIGRSMPGERLYVMSGSSLQPLGAPGELCIAGAGVSRGYQGNREQVGGSFGSDPFAAGDRLYRTGDLARFRPDGQIEFLGRRDAQVKVRGYRIELGEIESALKQFAQPFHDPIEVEPTVGAARRCVRCVLSAGYPGIRFDDTGVCSRCREFDRFQDAARDYFRPFDELNSLLDRSRAAETGDHDCLLLYSGGKDSSYVLHRLVEMGLSVLAFTFDNGFISPAAFENIERQTSRLGVECIVSKAPQMDAIFVESLTHDHTVCTGCFKALTTISTRLAADRGIPAVLTGLSRGQIFETKIEGLFRSGVTAVADVEAQLRSFRRIYHAQEDRTARLLDLSVKDVDLDRFQFIDFFRYDATPVSKIKAYLAERDRFWSKPKDTGFCSSNCMMNDIGICVHGRDRGYHNYEAPLSWDVRLGIIGRNDALAEVESPLDIQRVNGVLDRIGFLSRRIDHATVVVSEGAWDQDRTLCAYFTSNHELTVQELRAHLSALLPGYMVPQHFMQLPAIPLTKNGKVDFAALPGPDATVPVSHDPAVAPEGASQERVAAIWSEVLGVPVNDVQSSFFEYGGASLQAMDVMFRVCEAFDIQLSLQSLFQAPTVRDLAGLVERTIEKEIASLSDDEVARLLASEPES
jgi:amino acid adenylation domain-containing protein